MWPLKGFALFAAAAMVLVVFSQNVNPEVAPAGGDLPEEFEEQARRLTLAGGDSRLPSASIGPRDVIQLSWVDTRGGQAGVYHKSSANGGRTFTGDRAIATGFAEIGSVDVESGPQTGIVAIAWDGVSGDTDPQVYVRTSSDGGGQWGGLAVLGPGRSPSLSLAPGGTLLAYVHANETRDQIRLLRLSVNEGQIESAQAVLGFNSSAIQLALIRIGGVAHIVWLEPISGAAALAHVSVDLEARRASEAHLVAVVQGSVSGRLQLVGRPGRLGVFWSELDGGDFDLRARWSTDGGASWASGTSPAAGPSNQLTPSASMNATGYTIVAWSDDRLGVPQVFARTMGATGVPASPPARLSKSVGGGMEPAVALGSRVTAVAWSDGRDGPLELYGDFDPLLERFDPFTIRTYARRLEDSDFAQPERESHRTFLDLIQGVWERVERRDEADAASFIRSDVWPRMDGTWGGDPRDDLLVNAIAQLRLGGLLRGLLRILERSEEGGTRTGEDIGEPDPPGGGRGSDPPAQPMPPGDEDPVPAKPVISTTGAQNVTATTAVIPWSVKSLEYSVVESWVDWGTSTPLTERIWDNSTPYQVALTGLTANTTYRFRISARTDYAISMTYLQSFFTGVQITGITATNVSSTSATIEWSTNLPATSRVEDGTNLSLGGTVNGTSGTWHSVNITGLNPRQRTYYRVVSQAVEDSSLLAASGTLWFDTVLLVTNVTRQASQANGYYNVTFRWQTNFNGTSEARYGARATVCGMFGGCTNLSLLLTATGANGTSHEVTIGNLNSATSYEWYLFSAMTTNTSLYATHEGTPFRTPGIAVTNAQFPKGTSWILAKFNTTYKGDARVQYWKASDPANKTWSNVSESTVAHAVNLTALPSGTTYKFRLYSRSASNASDTGTSWEYSATTAGISLSGISHDPGPIWSAITWSSNVNGTSVVRYGFSSIWEQVATEPNQTSHAVNLTDLHPDTVYVYRVESSSLTNPNDTAVSTVRSFKTDKGQNDANSSADAGGTLATALHVEPASWIGALNSTWDLKDFYRFRAFEDQQIWVVMTPVSGFDYDLYLYNPSNTLVASSTTPVSGAPEAVYADVGTAAGFWKIEVRWSSSTAQEGNYSLRFNATGGRTERFILDVGSPGDTDTDGNTPGLVIGSGWGSQSTSSSPSTATDEYVHGMPDYREATANATFYLNLYRNTAERYTDYLLTLQYYGSDNVNVSSWNGAGWVVLASVPGQSNWAPFSLLVDHTAFFDAEPTWPGMNVKLRVSGVVQMDLIAASPARFATYVGSGSDDALRELHLPGIYLYGGWVDEGQGYKNVTSLGATIVVTPSDTNAAYQIAMRFDGNATSIRVEIADCPCAPPNTPSWRFLANLWDFTDRAVFAIDPTVYEDAFSDLPGTNLWLRLTPEDHITNVTAFVMTPVHWETDVGVAGDNDASKHLPGLSVYPNIEWGAPTTVDGRTARVSTVPGANVYLNMPWPTGSMIGYVTYKASQNGVVRLYDGVTWTAVGTIVGDGAWHTAVLFNQGLAVAQDPNQDPALQGLNVPRVFHDDYGDAYVNALLEFTVAVSLDAMWLDIDQDGDNLTSFGEANWYAYEDTTAHTLRKGQYMYVDFTAYTEARYAFSIKIQFRGIYDPPDKIYSEVSIAFNGLELYREDTWKTVTKTFGFTRNLCLGSYRLRIGSHGDADLVVLKVWKGKYPTDPDSPDTDGDGLRDGAEPCQKGTDPANPDTDGDGLTDLEEVYEFTYTNSSAVGYAANTTVNVTVDALSEYQWTIKTTGKPATGKTLEARVYLDGQLRWSHSSASQWNNLTRTFTVMMPSGLHGLQVQKASATGSLALHLAKAEKVLTTNVLYRDTDGDGLSDGDELKGLTGWLTSPVTWDTDGDGASDGQELRALRSDPMRRDTDGDGVADGSDIDPNFDLVLQVRVSYLYAYEGTNPNEFYVEVGVNSNWTRTQTKASGVFLDHFLSVNVPDSVSNAIVFLRGYRSDAVQVDVMPGSDLAYSTSFAVGNNWIDRCSSGDGWIRGQVCFDIRTMKVGKVNTLLVVPNDWSTLQNGTVDGAPSGLHRYVGEQRFVVGLFNVTDGTGTALDWDMESRDYGGSLRDLSGYLQRGSIYGPWETTGYFGRALGFDGVNDYVGALGSTGLDAITADLTLSFWIRPERDYVDMTTSAYGWSVGRQGQFRLGWYGGSVDGLRLSLWDGTTERTYDATQAPLYRSRWYHVAATYEKGVSSQDTWVRIFVNGVELKFWHPTPFNLGKDANQAFRVGQAGAGGYFHGAVDEVKVYKEALKPDAVRGLMWFTHGANNVLIPRGIFYESELNETLSGSWSAFNTTDQPLKDAVINGNDNVLPSCLNGRPIQMVVSKNLTLAEAHGILESAVTNRSGDVTAFPWFATSEWYTLGFVGDLDNVTANTVVVNSANASAPVPPPSLWELFWNTITGIAEFVWNAAVAVGQFFQRLGQWLVDLWIGLMYGILFDNWTYLQEKVIEPLVEAILAIVNFILDLVKAFVDAVVVPLFEALLSPLKPWVAAILGVATASWIEFAGTGKNALTTLAPFREIFVPMLLAGLGIAVVVLIIGVLLTPFMAFTFLLDAVLAVVMLAVLAAFAVSGSFTEGWPQAPTLDFPALLLFAVDFLDPDPFTPWDWIRMTLPWILTIAGSFMADPTLYMPSVFAAMLAILGSVGLIILSFQVWADFPQSNVNNVVKLLGVVSLMGILLNMGVLLWRVIGNITPKPGQSFLNYFGIFMGSIGVIGALDYLDAHPG